MNSTSSSRYAFGGNAHAAPRSKGISRLRDASRPGTTRVGLRALRDFADFAGSRGNVANLVTGLAWGVPVTLTAHAHDGRACTSTTFIAPGGPMRECDIYACLALARRQLADLGIPRPAPEHVRAALVGGVVVETDGTESRTLALTGLLILHDQGMSWAAVAASQGISLGRW